MVIIYWFMGGSAGGGGLKSQRAQGADAFLWGWDNEIIRTVIVASIYLVNVQISGSGCGFSKAYN